MNLSWTEYIVSEDDGTEMGIRHAFEGELDTPEDSERKKDDLVTWDYELMNCRSYRKFKNGELIDRATLRPNSLMLNSQEVWAGRNRFLQLPGGSS